ncbi:hypothetical protein BIW11_11791 [Tropilaelaps mercedesae]|uniref:Centrosome-associated FAM110 C-terminal domain-containing protein n=1 Tax=Tropilaelaps mercedesae TaxID=418985 RepID=A0A1V9X9Z1_9ACAR|nr:hypothetical protein BIW11_11791 [Tropilaelaps mercedesae]
MESSSFRSPGRDGSDANNVGGTRSLGRSKSDAATFASIPLSRCFKSQPNLVPPIQPFHYTLEDTALFFDTLGFLDASMFTALVQPSPTTTPPKFFESQSSQDSNNNSNENPSEGESEDELRNRLAPGPFPTGPRVGLSSHDLVEHAGGVTHETSIVEKNARVIKWLYNCRKSMQQSVVL